MPDISIRARIIAALVERLGDLDVPAGPRNGVAIGRDLRAWCEIDWVSEQARSHSPAHDVVGLEVRVAIYVRASRDAEARADELAVAAHRMIMQDRLVDGLAQDISTLGTVKEVDTHEEEQITITSAYAVQYRRRAQDISQGYP